MNFKRIIAVSAVAGMLAVTGCSSNTPARNQGNRNGQRVVDAVNRRPDSYTGERGTSRNMLGRTTRGINNRYTRTDNRSNTLGRPQNRVGTAFHRGNVRNNASTLNNDLRGRESAVNGTINTPAMENNSYAMNQTERGISNNGVNRSAKRSVNRSVNRSANSGTKTTPNRAARRSSPAVTHTNPTAPVAHKAAPKAVSAPAARTTRNTTHQAQAPKATSENTVKQNPTIHNGYTIPEAGAAAARRSANRTVSRSATPQTGVNRAARRANTSNRVNSQNRVNTQNRTTSQSRSNTQNRANKQNRVNSQTRTTRSANRVEARTNAQTRSNRLNRVNRASDINYNYNKYNTGDVTNNQIVSVANVENDNVTFFNKTKTEQPQQPQQAPQTVPSTPTSSSMITK